MSHTRGFPAIIATLVLASRSPPAARTTTRAAPPPSRRANSAGSAAGVAKAAEALKPFERRRPDQPKEPLKGAPPAGKSLVMLGTNDPNNQKLQKSLKELAALAKWKYELVSYDPANPATFNAAIDTAITKKADYIAEAGIPLTPAMIKKVQDAGSKWVLTSVHPAEVKAPVIVNTNAYANDEQMGEVLADFFITDSKGKGNVVIEHVPAYPILKGFIDGFQTGSRRSARTAR